MNSNVFRRRELMDGEKIFAVPDEYKDNIIDTYGNNLLRIRRLTELEEKYFYGSIVSSECMIQEIYKLKGDITTDYVKEKFTEFAASNIAVRTNFYNVRKEVWAVELRQPVLDVRVLSFRNYSPQEIEKKLSVAAQSERVKQKNFRSALVSILLVTLKFNETAMIITQPLVIAEQWSTNDFLYALFPSSYFGNVCLPEMDDVLKRELAVDKAAQREVSLNYWKKFLNCLPRTSRIPGFMHSKKSPEYRIHTVDLGAETTKGIFSLLTMNQQTMLVSFFCTIWGITLQRTGQSREICFPAVISHKNAAAGNISFTSAKYMIAVIRQVFQPDSTYKALAFKQMMQFIVSQKMNGCTYKDYQEICQQEEPFSHLLNFHGFFVDNAQYTDIAAEFGAKPIRLNIIDLQGLDFMLYFRYNGSSIRIDVKYNKYAYNDDAAVAIMQSYVDNISYAIQNWDNNIVYKISSNGYENDISALA